MAVVKVARAPRKRSVAELYKKYGLFIILAVLIVAMAFVNGNFLTANNIKNMMRQMAVNGLLALGVSFVILTGGIDLSVGSIVGLSGVIAALVAQNHGLPVLVPVLVGCLVGAVIGLVNGVITSVLDVPAFITTLGVLSISRGITYVINNARPIGGLSPQFLSIGKDSFLGVPIPMLILAVGFVIGMVVLYKTRFGRYIYAIGGNKEAAIVSGLKVKTIESAAYVISGLLAGVAGIVLTSRVTSGLATSGDGYELDAIAAAVIGGISLSGGEGRLWGTILGVLILAVIQNALDLLIVSSYFQLIIKGIIIVVAVLIDRQTKKANR